MRHAIFAATVLLLVANACGGDSTATDTTGDLGSSLWVVNATRAPLDVTVDGVHLATLAIASARIRSVSPGSHTIRLQAAGATPTDFSVLTEQDKTVNTVVQSSVEGQLIADVLADTAAIPAAGKTKLRILHLAATGQSLDIWRTQPDFHTPIRVMTPFIYGAESPYLQSDAGAWNVFVTTTTDANTKLADSGPINIESGQVYTVVLLDSAGVLKLRATRDH